MGKLAKRVLAILLMLTITFATAVPSQMVAAAVPDYTGEEENDIALQSDETVPTVTYTSVHDPSIVVGYIDGSASSYTSATKVYGVQNDTNSRTKIYFIFGSHRAWSYSFDLMNWASFTNNISTDYDSIFAEDAQWSALGGNQGSDSGEYEVVGNLWAPDVIWNPVMNKWCMYMSINGDSWYTSVVLLTADSLNGDWTRVGPVVYSGFTSEAEAQETDYFSVIDSSTNQKLEWDSRYTYNRNGNHTYGMNAIDPCVFYDEDGNLWMSYGSWFGGLFLIRLDQNNGLRDYTYTYKTDFDVDGTSYLVRSDAYQGIHIAGGNHASGEASYIEYINGYYYLFLTLGSLTAKGGYNMRVFRSETVDGSYRDADGNITYGGYVDESGDSAIYASAMDNVNANIGMRLMTYYKWNYMTYGYTAEGHNSAFVDDDGKAYLIYHTRTNDGTEGHEVRVHQLFQTESGWLAAAPFEYTGESLVTDAASADYLTTSDVAGTYEVILQKATQYASLVCNEGTNYQLKEDGTVIAGDNSGTWSWSEKGAPYASITIGGETYEGVFLKQRMEASTAAAASVGKAYAAGEETVVFTMIGKTGEIPMWGYQYVGDDQEIAEQSAAGLDVPTGTFMSISLPEECANGATVKWKSGNTAVMSDAGVVVSPQTDTTVTMTAIVTYGTATATHDYEIVVYAPQVSGEEKVVATYFTDSPIDLTNAVEGTYRYDNPFLSDHTFGLQAYNGVSIRFDLTRTSSGDPWLKDILEFGTGSVGGLYFDGNSYLGYNATGGFFDANFRNGSFGDLSWGWGTDYLGLTTGQTASVEIQILPTGYCVSINGKVVYTQDDIEPYNASQTTYTTPGQNSVTNYSDVLGYILSTATQLNFGWGDWWDGGYPGTISNVVLSALPVEIEDHSDYSYYEDFNSLAGKSGDATGFISANASDDVSVSYTSGKYGYYLDFKADTGKNSRSAYKDFGLDGSVTGNYTFETDLKITAANNQTSTFAILGTGSSAAKSPNLDITENYILKLKQTAANATTYTVNDGDTTVTIPNNTWIHITVAVDDAMNVYADIDGTLVKTTANGNSTLYGLYLLKGRYTGAISVDNIAWKDVFTCIHGETSWTASSETIEATCTEPGGYKVICSVCGWEGGNGTIPALGHAYGEGVVTEPTCTEQGYTTYTCSRCGDGYQADYTNPTGHQHTNVVNALAVTCTTDGYTGDTYCSDCGQLLETGSVIPAKGHSYESVVTEPTCTEQGYTTYTCSDCGDSYVEEIEALGHDWLADTSMEGSATCTESGIGYYECTRCHETKVVEGEEALGHLWDNGTVKIPATCTESGVMVYTCTRACCKDNPVTKEEEIPATGEHTYDMENGVVKKAATCIEKGVTTYTCIDCGATIDLEDLELADHNYQEQVTEATCTSQGYTTHTCTVCGDSYVDSYTHMIDHDYDNGVVIEEATVTKTGTIRYTCRACGDTYTKTIAKLTGTTDTKPGTTVNPVKLAKVSLKTISNTGKGVKITWAKAANAKGYYIYRKTGSGKYKKIASVSGQNKGSYTDSKVTNGKTYTYKVCAYNGKVTGSFGKTKKTLYLSRVKLSSVKNNKSKKATVKYKKNAKTAGYVIQYSTSQKFKSARKVTVKSAKKLSVVLKKLKKKKTYYVRVRAYKKSGKSTYYSTWSNVKTVKITK